jgi:bleomycin hydrolase
MLQKGAVKRPLTRSQTKKPRIEKEKDVQEDVLQGLSVTKNGKFVKIDDSLLQRLSDGQNGEANAQQLKINPFVNHPDFLQTIRNGTPITLEFLEQCSSIMSQNPDSMKMAEMVGNFPVDWLSLKRSKMLEDNWEYSVKLPITPKVTNQGNSGRCWAYSALNALRIPLMRKFNLEHKFEFSEAYLFFYDKIERSNMFLEYMWTLRDRPIEDRDVRSFTSPEHHFTSDGGFFTYFVNLASKYGIVPRNVYDECFNSMVSFHLNEALTNVLNHMALDIFRQYQNNSSWSRSDFQIYKDKCNTTIYDLVVRFLGAPPTPNTKFTWTYKDENGTSYSIPNMTAEKFYRTVVPHEHDTKMVIINDPRHPETYYMSSWSPYSVNMQGGNPITMINLPMDEFKKIICESLKNEEPVWFAADISRCLDRESNTSDTQRFDYKSVLGTDVEFDKGDMLDMHTAVPNHALLFIGVDTIEDADRNVVGYTKFRIENSWGNSVSLEDELDFGYYRMMDDYVDKYVYEAAVDLKYFSSETMVKILDNSNAGKTFTYSPYDAFGALASRAVCKHCSNGKFEKRPGFKK